MTRIFEYQPSPMIRLIKIMADKPNMRVEWLLRIALLAAICCSFVQSNDSGAGADSTDSGEPAFLQGTTKDQRQAYELAEQGSRLEQDSPEEACKCYESALSLDPDDVIATRQAHRDDMRWVTYRALADSLSRLGRHEEAREVLGRLMTRFPEADPVVWQLVAHSWELQGERQRALGFYWKACIQARIVGWDLRREWADAVRRNATSEEERVSWIDMEIAEFGDWKSYYHRAQVLAALDNQMPASQTIPRLERAIEDFCRAREMREQVRTRPEEAEAESLLEDRLSNARRYLEQERARAEMEGTRR